VLFSKNKHVQLTWFCRWTSQHSCTKSVHGKYAVAVAEELLTCPELEDPPRAWVEEHGSEPLEHSFLNVLFLGVDGRGDYVPCRCVGCVKLSAMWNAVQHAVSVKMVRSDCVHMTAWLYSCFSHAGICAINSTCSAEMCSSLARIQTRMIDSWCTGI